MVDIKNSLDEAAEDIIKEIRYRLVHRGQGKGFNDTGAASDSLKHEVLITDNKIQLKIIGNRYIGALDKGRRPNIGGGEPWRIETLMGWVERKLGIPAPKNRSIAFAIKNKIVKTGTALYRGEYTGLELDEVRKMGANIIIEKISTEYINDLKSMVRDLSEGVLNG